MPRPRKAGLPGQLSLLDLIDRVDRARSVAGDLRRALVEDLKASRYPRDQVAGRMGRLLERDITQAQLDAWTATSHVQHRFPVEYLPAFVESTGEWRTLRLVVEACGGRLVVPELVRRELGEVEIEQKRLAQRGRVLRVLVEADETGVLG